LTLYYKKVLPCIRTRLEKADLPSFVWENGILSKCFSVDPGTIYTAIYQQTSYILR